VEVGCLSKLKPWIAKRLLVDGLGPESVLYCVFVSHDCTRLFGRALGWGAGLPDAENILVKAAF